jgi:ribosome maturation factor RimP
MNESVHTGHSPQQEHRCVAVLRGPSRGKGLNFEEQLLSGANFLETLLAPAVEAQGYRLVRLRLMGGKRKTLQILAERPDGQMDVEDCAKLSRALSEVLEASDPISEEYVLEVSSPGIDRPLTAPEDFARFAGHEARIELVRGIDGRRRFKGTLIALEDSDVVMDVLDADGRDTRRVRFPFSDIAEAKLVLTDRLIQESLKAREKREASASH